MSAFSFIQRRKMATSKAIRQCSHSTDRVNSAHTISVSMLSARQPFSAARSRLNGRQGGALHPAAPSWCTASHSLAFSSACATHVVPPADGRADGRGECGAKALFHIVFPAVTHQPNKGSSDTTTIAESAADKDGGRLCVEKGFDGSSGTVKDGGVRRGHVQHGFAVVMGRTVAADVHSAQVSTTA